MLLSTLIICISIQLVMAYYFALAQVKLDSQYMWNERCVILHFTANLQLTYALVGFGIAPHIDRGGIVLLWGFATIIPISFMYYTYFAWIEHKHLVRNGYIKIYTFLR